MVHGVLVEFDGRMRMEVDAEVFLGDKISSGTECKFIFTLKQSPQPHIRLKH